MGALARTLRHEAGHPEDWAVWVLRLGLVAGLVFALFLTRIPSGQASPGTVGGAAALGLVLALAVSAAPGRSLRALRVVELCLLLSVALHVAGHVFGIYASWPRYDSIVHGVGGFLAGLAAIALVRGTDLVLPRGEATRFRVAFVALGVMAMTGVAVELVEFGSDSWLATREQTDPVQEPLRDTMWDLVAESIGGLVAVALGTFLVKDGHVRFLGSRAKRTKRAARRS